MSLICCSQLNVSWQVSEEQHRGEQSRTGSVASSAQTKRCPEVQLQEMSLQSESKSAAVEEQMGVLEAPSMAWPWQEALIKENRQQG